jgi:hypothetical protein
MSIIESIKEARRRGIKDSIILQEIIKQNPEKKSSFSDVAKKGANPTQVLNEIIRRGASAPQTPAKEEQTRPALSPAQKAMPSEERRRIEEAKRRIEALKKEVQAKNKQRGLVREQNQEDQGVEPDVDTIKTQEERVEKEKELMEEKKEIRFEKFAKAAPQVAPLQEKKAKLYERFVPPKKEAVKMDSVRPIPPVPPSIPRTDDAKISRPLPPKPSFKEKLWIRITVFSLILAVLAGVSTFWYWYIVIRNRPPVGPGCTSNQDCPAGYVCNANKVCMEGTIAQKCVNDSECPQNHICNQEGDCIEAPKEPTVPASLLTVDETRVLSIASPGELQNLLAQATQEWLDSGRIRRIVVKNTTENKILGLKEFFEAMLIRAPQELFQKVENDFTLFIYSQTEGNRLGFVAVIKNPEGLEALLKTQESTMEGDFQTLFTLMGKSGPAITAYFRNASNIKGYVGPNFRFQSLAKNDLGICYLSSGSYFVFASSWGSIGIAIEQLGITGDLVELTRDLKVGDTGDDVTLLQTWLKQDPVIYPQGTVTGSFGNYTRQAVIRFQERHASEILAPQGLANGTGEVDLYTRIKLNELYGKSGVIIPSAELITDLRYGDHGSEVKLLQTWLAKDKEVYPEGITSGWFGYLTKQAVTKFQEKYTQEILTPQGLNRGTGIVDALTRKKLNDLYGK